MPLKDADLVSNAIGKMQEDFLSYSNESLNFNATINNLNYELTLGIPGMIEGSKSFIRNDDGYFFFMIGVDQVDSFSRTTD